MWMKLLLAMEINWTTYNIFLSILIKQIKLPPFSFVSMTHVCHHTQGWSTQNSPHLITFLWADSQNSIIFIGSSHMWNAGQTVLSRMFAKDMWLQLWFSNMPFYHKMWEHLSSRQNWEYSNLHPLQHVYTWIHMPREVCILVVYKWCYTILQSLNEDGIWICTPYQCYILPHLVNKHPNISFIHII